jgi:glycine/D-amino acid oxidase-like deaminating enzyme
VHPVLGPTDVDGFWLANGFSGHGFKLAPAIGSMLALDREPIGLSSKNVLA